MYLMSFSALFYTPSNILSISNFARSVQMKKLLMITSITILAWLIINVNFNDNNFTEITSNNVKKMSSNSEEEISVGTIVL